MVCPVEFEPLCDPLTDDPPAPPDHRLGELKQRHNLLGVKQFKTHAPSLIRILHPEGEIALRPLEPAQAHRCRALLWGLAKAGGALARDQLLLYVAQELGRALWKALGLW